METQPWTDISAPFIPNNMSALKALDPKIGGGFNQQLVHYT